MDNVTGERRHTAKDPLVPVGPRALAAAERTVGRTSSATAASFLAEAQRVAKLLDHALKTNRTCALCLHPHRDRTCAAEVERAPVATDLGDQPGYDGDAATTSALCGCRTFEPQLADDEYEAIVRTIRGEGPAPAIEATPRERLIECLIPERFRTATFATYEPVTPSQRAALKAAQRFVARVLEGEHAMLALIGDTGVGKSHLAYAALRELIVAFAGRRTIYARGWYTLADELRYGGVSPYSGATIEAHEVRRLMREARIAVIDEIRYTSGTEFDATELGNYGCHAYDVNASAIITTNASPLDLVTGPAAASRFTQVTIEGPDWRQQRGQRADVVDHRMRAAGED